MMDNERIGWIVDAYKRGFKDAMRELEQSWTVLATRLDTINDRTKRHTLDIRKLRNALGEQ